MRGGKGFKWQVLAVPCLLLGMSAALPAPGDYKHGYETSHYQTRSLSLEARQGVPADLMQLIEDPPLGLPPVPVPASNPITRDKVELGRKLFYDRRLSR